jgi:hypothetical protein
MTALDAEEVLAAVGTARGPPGPRARRAR